MSSGSPVADSTLMALLDQVALAEAADLARAGRYAKAEGLLAALTGRQPPALAAVDLLARIRAQQGRLEEARALWMQALEQSPADRSYAAGLRRIELLRRPALLRFDLGRLAAPTLALALVGLSAWVAVDRYGVLGRAVQGLSADVVALGQQVDRQSELQAASPKPSPEPALAEAVAQALQSDPDLGSLGLQVHQIGLGIALDGTVPAARLKAQAETRAKAVAGVALVDSSGIVVQLPPLAGAVQDALQADSRTAGVTLEVEQVQQGVRLRGVVPSLEARVAVEEVARGVQGVALVDSTGLRVEPPFAECIVQPGDSLASIARHYYGDATQWPLIYEANLDEIASPNEIRAGMHLAVPLTNPQ